MVKDMEVEFGKKKKEKDGTTTRKRKRDKMEESCVVVPFKKQSSFFKYLSYWKELDTPHAIDSMHLEKNVFQKHEKIRSWSTQLRVPDYLLPSIGLGKQK